MVAHDSNESFDVIVVGAGPAGCSAAAVLAEKGHCPFTKEPLAVHSLIKLTKGNIDKYRHLIIAT